MTGCVHKIDSIYSVVIGPDLLQQKLSIHIHLERTEPKTNWMDGVLGELWFSLHYYLSKTNIVVNAFSRKSKDILTSLFCYR